MASAQASFSRANSTAAILYALNLWPALPRYCENILIEIHNTAAERALHGIAIGRRNYLFAGAESGGERAGAIYSLIGTTKQNGVDPEAWLSHVLTQIADLPVDCVDELLP
jgi:transposase